MFVINWLYLWGTHWLLLVHLSGPLSIFHQCTNGARLVTFHKIWKKFILPVWWVMQRFNRKITRDDAKNMTVADVLEKIEEGNWGNRADYAKDWQEFVDCWNEIYRLINVDDHTRLDELRNDCVMLLLRFTCLLRSIFTDISLRFRMIQKTSKSPSFALTSRMKVLSR